VKTTKLGSARLKKSENRKDKKEEKGGGIWGTNHWSNFFKTRKKPSIRQKTGKGHATTGATCAQGEQLAGKKKEIFFTLNEKRGWSKGVGVHVGQAAGGKMDAWGERSSGEGKMRRDRRGKLKQGRPNQILRRKK